MSKLGADEVTVSVKLVVNKMFSYLHDEGREIRSVIFLSGILLRYFFKYYLDTHRQVSGFVCGKSIRNCGKPVCVMKN
jgi:hypothetical protein